ncbi:AAA family ATPase [Kocuria rosea]|uniref:AAA family ATPase n=1 Tax=Kocuria rosea TaxID=1275 RepID=UPI001643F77E|nr:AAA family ATPase [Kocuria rosea]
MNNYTDPAAPDPLDEAFSASWLTDQEFPPVEYVVPGVIPEGLTLLTAAPKIGKSWMVLGLGVAAATGGHAFGRIKVDRRPVLYLALEDGQRRLKSRLRAIGVGQGPSDLIFMTSTPAGAAVTISTFLERNSGRKPLIVLDTLGKVRGVYSGNDAYGKDYNEMGALKELVDAHPGSSLIVVHHTKKAETVDFLDSVSGTQGLAGAADSILVLQRPRHGGSAVLHVTSRDAAEGEYAVTFNGSNGTWSLDGVNLAEAAKAVEANKATNGVGDEMAELVKIISRHPDGIRRKDIETLSHMDSNTVGTYLRRATEAGRIENPKRGVYAPVTSATSVTFPNAPLPNVTDVADVTPLHLEVVR